MPMGDVRIDMVGQRYGRLVVTAYHSTVNNKKAYWLCNCDCGQTTVVHGTKLRSGHTKSCGCLNREQLHRGLYRTHGMRHSPEYAVWRAMHRRANTVSFNYYGARGITVCEDWHNFANFYTDMGPRPSAQYSIDRIDNDGNYEPTNCVWALRKQQARNTRLTRSLTWNGQTLPIAEWAERLSINYQTLYKRWAHGWPVDKIFRDHQQDCTKRTNTQRAHT
jgi:hypothetical protein